MTYSTPDLSFIWIASTKDFPSCSSIQLKNENFYR